jgi:hypothetical protein
MEAINYTWLSSSNTKMQALTANGELGYLGPQWRRDIAFAGNDVPLQVPPPPLPPAHFQILNALPAVMKTLPGGGLLMPIARPGLLLEGLQFLSAIRLSGDKTL